MARQAEEGREPCQGSPSNHGKLEDWVLDEKARDLTAASIALSLNEIETAVVQVEERMRWCP